MTASLRRRLQRELGRAASWEQGHDPAPVLEALGYASFIDAIGARDLLGRDEAKTLRRAGSEVLLAFGRGENARSKDSEDAEDLAIARRKVLEVARAGLASLGQPSATPHLTGTGGRSALMAAEPATSYGGAAPQSLHPPSTTLVRMLGGDVDGLTAGRWAAHLRSCASCKNEIAIARTAAGELDDAVGLAVAAARPAMVRPPASGRVVGEKKRPALEAVLFEDETGRRLAVYAQASAPVRLVADGVTTEDTLEGYWIGRVEPGVTELRAQVYVGDDVVEWVIDLTGEAPRR